MGIVLVCACGHLKTSHKAYLQAQNGFKWEDCFAIVNQNGSDDYLCDCEKFRARGIGWDS